MNAREELEKVITKKFGELDIPCWGAPQKIAQAIIDKLPELGFIRLGDVEIDKEKVMEIMENESWSYEETGRNAIIGKKEFEEVATAIAEAKGILRMKEGKR